MPLALARRTPRPAGAPPLIRETDLDRLLKLIPTEILAIYTAAAPSVQRAGWTRLHVGLLVAGVLLAPLVLFLDGRATGEPAPWPQYVVRTVAFVGWGLAIAWPFGADDFEAWRGWPLAVLILFVPLVGAVWWRKP
ncbi:MAG TPA: hypothetical protein VGM88_11960 [Kofleriaceae bacterium]|jgi:hypothetical protein